MSEEIADSDESFLAGGGEMAKRVRAIDWTVTPLGPIHRWPQSLRSALSICLNSNFPIAIYWGSDLVLFYNDEWSPIPGEKHPLALGRPASEVWPEIWHIIEPLFRQVVTTGEATRSRDQLLPMRRFGFTEECYFDYTFSPIRGERGTVEGVFNAVLETTTRVIGERRLTTLRRLATWKMDEAHSAEETCEAAAIVISENPYDLPFVVIYLLDEENQRATRASFTGVTPDDTGCPPVIDLNVNKPAWPLDRVIESRTAVEVDNVGHLFGTFSAGAWPESPQQAVILPMANPGQVQLAGFIIAGVSPRLALNDAYRGFLDLLAGHVAASVANARAYEEAHRRAEALAELDRAKTRFFSNISHEFRTPLTLMIGPLGEIVSQEDINLSPAVKFELEVVNRNALRLLKLVNTLLDFARIEAGRRDAVYQPTDLAAVTADLTSVFRSACERAGLRLVVDCPPLDHPVFVDRDMWEKIVLNLLSNAFKFTFEGQITVSLRRIGEVAELRVADTGTGIPPKEIARIFERFHRIEDARGRTHEGSGIGLSLVQELVKLHGGSVRVESEFGRGSVFVISLPLGSDHLAPAQIRNVATDALLSGNALSFGEEALHWLPDLMSDASAVSFPSRQPESAAMRLPHIDAKESRPRILIADDNADMRHYLVRLLADDYQVVAVPDGKAALREAREQIPDLILTDVMMPRLDGFGLLRELRADPETSSLPVIMLSARAGEESRVEGMKAGADDYLVKPFSANELRVRVSALLQLTRIRRTAAESLRQGEERLRMALTAARMLAWEFDPATDHILFSDNVFDVYGLRPGTTLRTRNEWLNLVHVDDVERHQSIVMKAVQESGEYVSQFRMTRPVDGGVIWLEERGHAVQKEAGESTRFVGVVMDITNKKRDDDRLRHMAAALSEADRRKNEFLAILAHELRNPLAPIGNGLQLMRLACGNEIAVEQTRTMMERQLTQLVRLVDDLMDISRISQGKLELRREPIELADVLNNAIETSQPLFEEMGHRLELAIPKESLVVNADLIRLSQVFMNLLINAAKYSDRDGHVIITVERHENMAHVSVRDHGIGIDADQLPRIFDMFSQVNRSLERSQGGLGIGLSLVKQFVDMHGGTIEGRSEGPDKGSEFVVSLPLVVKTVSQTQSAEKNRRPLTPALRILIVDDNRDSANSLALLLKTTGNQTRAAYDGEQAIAAWNEFRPDVMLLDIGLPKLNGYEACRRIRQQEGGQEVLIIAQTGWGQEEDRQRTRESGFDHHMVKPINPTLLMTILTNRAQAKIGIASSSTPTSSRVSKVH